MRSSKPPESSISAAGRVSHLSRTIEYLKSPMCLMMRATATGAHAGRTAPTSSASAGAAQVVPRTSPIRVALVKTSAERFEHLELNLAITAVPTDDSGIRI